jgi:hypothetical protein
VIKKIIENFQKYGKLEFIALEFSSWLAPNLHELGRKTLSKINSLQFKHFRIDLEQSICVNNDSGSINFNDLLCGGEMDEYGRLVPGTTAWPALTELVFNDCNMDNIDMQRLADFFPQLENLSLTPKISFNYFYPTITTDNPFCNMNNIRVLKLDHVCTSGMSIFKVDCLPHLEKLFLRVHGFFSNKQIDSFPHFPKLTELSLHLNQEKQFSPNAFDHLTQLTRFEINNMLDEDFEDYDNDLFETGVAARFMSFHLQYGKLKLTSRSVSKIEELELNCSYENGNAALPLSGLKSLTTSKWANAELPFHQMTNLECLKLNTDDLSIISTGQLKCLAKLRVLEISPGKFRRFGPFQFKTLSEYSF